MENENDIPLERLKPIFGYETVSFDVIGRTDTTVVLEFWYEREADDFFSGLREAGYQGENGRLRLRMKNNCEVGVPVHAEITGFGNVEWSPTSDPTDGVVLDGTI